MPSASHNLGGYQGIKEAVTITAHFDILWPADAISLLLTCYVLGARFLNRYDDDPLSAPKATTNHPPTGHPPCQWQSMPLVCICFLHLLFFLPFFKSNKQRHRQGGERKHGKCQHTLKRLANGDNVKHERSLWSVRVVAGGGGCRAAGWGLGAGGIRGQQQGARGQAKRRTVAKWVAIKWLKVPLALH